MDCEGLERVGLGPTSFVILLAKFIYFFKKEIEIWNLKINGELSATLGLWPNKIIVRTPILALLHPHRGSRPKK